MINVAVVGVGRMGSKHAYNLAKRVKGANLVAICDLDTQKANMIAKKLKAKAYYDVDEMLKAEKLDGVVIATPHYSHVDIALKCLDKGINILCEKPISVTTKEANKLLAKAKDSNLICSMMYNQRTNRMYQKARELIATGAIGKIQRVNFTITDWYRAQFYYNMGGWRASWSGEGGGTLINQCVHQLDLLQWLCGMPALIKSYNQTKGRRITTENDVTAIMRFDGFDCVFTASTHEIPGVNRLEIAGDKGIITIYSKTMKYRLNKMSEPEVNQRAKRDYGNKKDKTGKTYHYWYGLKNAIKDAIRGQQCNIIENFVAAVENKNKDLLIAPLEEGIKALTLINALNMSSWENEEIKIPFDDEEYAELLKEKIDKEKQDK
ncbi:MAG: Gfo/Idh/MocA family oxidoreductase [Clostridiales bacterium]|nr:Gfo/Idh/MocA family oxidoreductase [Clostridiales bacterium]